MTYVLGARSRANLEGVHARLVAVVERAIQITTQDFGVNEGLRTWEQQVENVRRGVSKSMNSKHLRQSDGFGHAVDLVPYINGTLKWSWPAIYPIAAAMRQAAREQGVAIVWGGCWDRALNDLQNDPKYEMTAYNARHPGIDFDDGPHYEMR